MHLAQQILDLPSLHVYLLHRSDFPGPATRHMERPAQQLRMSGTIRFLNPVAGWGFYLAP